MKNLLSKEKLVLLHSIRGFAALIVVIAHVKFPFWSGGVANVSSNKHLSVNLPIRCVYRLKCR